MNSFEKWISIPGARKCGTTTLYHMLSAHPHIATASVKEPQFFALSRALVQSYKNWYLALFEASTGDVLLDGSTFYLPSSWAVQNIDAVVPDPRFVIMIRDPANRAYSAYLHMRKKVPQVESRSFSKIVADLETICNSGSTSLEEAEARQTEQASEKGLIDATYLNGKYLAKQCGAPFESAFEDPLWTHKYFSESLYSVHVRRYVSAFGRESVKIVMFEDLIANPTETMAAILSHLELPFCEKVLVLKHKKKAKVPRGPIGTALLAVKSRSNVADMVWRRLRTTDNVILSRIVPALRAVVRKEKPRLTRELYLRARSLLAEEYNYWKMTEERASELWSIEANLPAQ